MRLLLTSIFAAIPLIGMAQTDTLAVAAASAPVELTSTDSLPENSLSEELPAALAAEDTIPGSEPMAEVQAAATPLDEADSTSVETEVADLLSDADTTSIAVADTLQTPDEQLAEITADTVSISSELPEPLAALDSADAGDVALEEALAPTDSPAASAEPLEVVATTDSLTASSQDSLSIAEPPVVAEVEVASDSLSVTNPDFAVDNLLFNPLTDTIRWDYGEITNRRVSEKVTLNGHFISYGTEGLLWVQNGMQHKYYFDITSTEGEWRDLSQDGELIFQASCENLSGSIHVLRQNKKLKIRLDFSQPDKLTPNIEVHVTTISKL